jgi:hypothetical protein
MQSKEKLTTLCGLSKEETELDFSSQGLRAGDAVLIANDISDMRALTSLDVSHNDIGQLVLSEGWSEKNDMFGHVEGYKHTDGREQKDNPGNPEGIIAIANVIPDMSALTKFDISENNLRAEGSKALAAGLKSNRVITELNIGSNMLGSSSNGRADTSGVFAIADAIGDMKAISKLTFGDKQAINMTMTTEMTEANFSSKLFSCEVQIVAAFLPKCT